MAVAPVPVYVHCTYKLGRVELVAMPAGYVVHAIAMHDATLAARIGATLDARGFRQRKRKLHGILGNKGLEGWLFHGAPV